MSKLATSAGLQKFQDLERRLASVGLYAGAIDDDWGPGIDAAIEKLFGSYKPSTAAPAAAAPAGQEAIAWPAKYAWLSDQGPLPRLTAAAGRLLGTKETPGTGNSPTIMRWKSELAALKLDVAGFTSDAVAWCGLGMGKIALDAGYGTEIPSHPLWALNWSDFGVPAKQPCLGAILTFIRDGGGHVATYIAEDSEAYHVLGCNQSDSVTITRILKSRLHAVREPAYNVRPASARPFIASSVGALSTNER